MANSVDLELHPSVDLEVYNGLEAQFETRADEFISLMSMEFPATRRQRDSVDSLGLTSVALYELESIHETKAAFYPLWLRATQTRLKEHTADRPSDQELLRETIFFEPIAAEARSFNSQMYRRVVEPHKTKQLSTEAFAQGVLLGGVTLRT